MRENIRHVATRFGDIAYTEKGSGPAAIFVHGVLLNGYWWRHVINRVADIRRCIALDQFAHGATHTPAEQDVSCKAQARMLEDFCAALGLDQIDLVANDTGGSIAQIFAARNPQRIRSLTLTNCEVHDNWPPAAFEPMRKHVAEGRLAEFCRTMLGDIERARTSFALCYEHPERLSMETLRVYLEPLVATPEALRNIERWFSSYRDCRPTVEVEPLLRRLEAPTLVVWGTGDVYFPVRWACWLRDTIPGCRKLITLEGARLFFPEERPEELAQALREHWQVKQTATAA